MTVVIKPILDKNGNCIKCLGCNKLETNSIANLQVCNNYIQDETNKIQIYNYVQLKMR